MKWGTKIRRVLVAVFVIVCVWGIAGGSISYADTSDLDSNFDYLEDADGYVTIVKYNGSDTSVILPTESSVKYVGNDAFSSSVTCITVGSNR